MATIVSNELSQHSECMTEINCSVSMEFGGKSKKKESRIGVNRTLSAEKHVTENSSSKVTMFGKDGTVKSLNDSKVTIFDNDKIERCSDYRVTESGKDTNINYLEDSQISMFSEDGIVKSSEDSFEDSENNNSSQSVVSNETADNNNSSLSCVQSEMLDNSENNNRTSVLISDVCYIDDSTDFRKSSQPVRESSFNSGTARKLHPDELFPLPIFFKRSKKDKGSELHDKLISELNSVLDKRKSKNRNSGMWEVDTENQEAKYKSLREQKKKAEWEDHVSVFSNKELLAKLEKHFADRYNDNKENGVKKSSHRGSNKNEPQKLQIDPHLKSQLTSQLNLQMNHQVNSHLNSSIPVAPPLAPFMTENNERQNENKQGVPVNIVSSTTPHPVNYMSQVSTGNRKNILVNGKNFLNSSFDSQGSSDVDSFSLRGPVVMVRGSHSKTNEQGGSFETRIKVSSSGVHSNITYDSPPSTDQESHSSSWLSYHGDTDTVDSSMRHQSGQMSRARHLTFSAEESEEESSVQGNNLKSLPGYHSDTGNNLKTSTGNQSNMPAGNWFLQRSEENGEYLHYNTQHVNGNSCYGNQTVQTANGNMSRTLDRNFRHVTTINVLHNQLDANGRQQPVVINKVEPRDASLDSGRHTDINSSDRSTSTSTVFQNTAPSAKRTTSVNSDSSCVPNTSPLVNTLQSFSVVSKNSDRQTYIVKLPSTDTKHRPLVKGFQGSQLSTLTRTNTTSYGTNATSPNAINITLPRSNATSRSPFTQEIGEGLLPTAHGDGLYHGEEDKPTTFYIESSGMVGEPSISVDGPNSIAKCSIDPQPDGRYSVTYVPVEVGMFDVHVLWNGKNIHGSPFHPKIVDPRKVHVVGGWQHYMDAQDRIILAVNEEKQIPFDCSEAGPGKLTAEVKGPTGSLPCRVDDHSVGRSVVCFTPREEGKHQIHVHWADIPIIHSPFLGYATSGTPDISKVILTGRGLKEAIVREEAEFIIDGSQAGQGDPEVQLTGVKAEVNVIVSTLGGGKFRCTYIPTIPGAYLLHISWNGRQLRGSPYKVNVIGAFYPNKVIVGGEGLKGGLLGRDLDIKIDTRKAGPGELAAYCMGPNKAAYCELEDNHDGTYRLSVKPQETGRHILQVKYGGEHVHGSPFVFRISAQPDASKVRVSGPGVEDGILATFQSRFIVETRGAGAGQLMVRIRGPKGAFQVEMYRDSQKDRTILCRYDPTECGLYIVNVKWSNVDVPGSPFHVHIVDTQAELEQCLQEASYNHTLPSSRSGYTQWREDI